MEPVRQPVCPSAEHASVLQLLDLHGRATYLLSDISKAHDILLSMPLTDGYSSDVIAGRRELLDYLKEEALLHEGRVQQSKGIDVPIQLLPSALALLAQVRPCFWAVANTGWRVNFGWLKVVMLLVLRAAHVCSDPTAAGTAE